MLRRVALLPLLALASAASAADPFATRLGESGIVDVPDAEILPAGGGRFTGELRYDRVSSVRSTVGPLPLALGLGLGRRLEVSFSAREWAMPDDPRPAPVLFGGALKLQILPPEKESFGLALDAFVDRANAAPVLGSRAIASATHGRFRLAGFAGVEGHGPGPAIGFLGGGAAAVALRGTSDVALEALVGPRGPMLASAFRWEMRPNLGVSLGLAWLPSDGGLRLSLGLSTLSVPRVAKRPQIFAPSDEGVVPVGPLEPTFQDPRPRFRMKFHPPLAPDRRQHHERTTSGTPVSRAPAQVGPATTSEVTGS